MTTGIATERAMKRALDGTFTKLPKDGGVKTVRVRRDYLPTYDGTFPPGHVFCDDTRVFALRVKLRTPFTDHDDRRIIALKRTGASMRRIADAIGRQQGSVDQRVRHLKREGRI